MNTIRNNTPWMLALVAGVCLVAAAVVVADRQSAVVADQQPAQVRRGAADARELSSVFRHVAQEALPSIVSIETLGKAAERPQVDLPFDENSPFRDFFENNPQFREFFKNQPQGGIMPQTRGLGSGFIIDPSGIVMTNSHVVADAERVKLKLADGREFIATDIKTDPRSDVAIVRFDAPQGLKPIPLGDSAATEIGDWVLAVGSPFGLDLSVTAGIISAKGRGPGIAEREDFLQTDAAINPGNSGGPLLNLDGEVIGINTAISSRSGGYEGIGFAVPVNMAKWVSKQLVANGQVKRAYIGVAIQQVDSDLAKKFGVAVGEGAIVSQVMPDSPAADAKLEIGDVILDLDGQKIRGTRNLQGIVEMLAVDKSYKMTILRNADKMSIDITLRHMPDEFSTAVRQRPGRPDRRNEAKPQESTNKELGIDVRELTDELARQLGFEGVSGVVVSSVETNSLAYQAGLRNGVVIQKIGSTEIKSLDDFEAAMKNASLKDGILLLVRTQAGTRFVVIQADK